MISIKYETGPNPNTRRPHPCLTTRSVSKPNTYADNIMYTQSTRTVGTSYHFHKISTYPPTGIRQGEDTPIQTFYACNQLVINNTYQTLTYKHHSKEINNIVHNRERKRDRVGRKGHTQVGMRMNRCE